MSEIGGWQRYQHWPCYPLSCFQNQRFHAQYDGAPFLKLYLDTIQLAPEWQWLNVTDWLQSSWPFSPGTVEWPKYSVRYWTQGPVYNLICEYRPNFIPVARGSWVLFATAQSIPFVWTCEQEILWPIGQVYWPRNQVIDFYESDWVQTGIPDPGFVPPAGRGELAPRQCCESFQWGQDPG